LGGEGGGGGGEEKSDDQPAEHGAILLKFEVRGSR
jgi:hypothetical protein